MDESALHVRLRVSRKQLEHLHGLGKSWALKDLALVTVTQNPRGNNAGQQAEVGKVPRNNLEGMATNPAPWNSGAGNRAPEQKPPVSLGVFCPPKVFSAP